MNWESIEHNHAGYLFRAKIIGGWLVKEVMDATVQVPNIEAHGGNYLTVWHNQENLNWTSSICFVPDPNHEWKL